MAEAGIKCQHTGNRHEVERSDRGGKGSSLGRNADRRTYRKKQHEE